MELCMYINEITYRYPKSTFQLSLKDIDLSSSVVALLGANGCGKSTLMKLISGQIDASGKNISDIDTDNKRIIVHDAFSYLNDFLTVRDHLQFFAHLHQRTEDEHEKVIHDCELNSLMTQRLDTLSAGQSARLRIASSLLAMPDVMLMDEPTTGCDLRTVEFFVQLVQMLVKRDVQCILVTHQLYEISSLQPTVFGIHEGHSLGLTTWQDDWNTASGLQMLMKNIVHGQPIAPPVMIKPSLSVVSDVRYV
jgi:ABC-2 type transport system ATP-binding protein